MSDFIEVNEQNFQVEVMQATQPVLVEFGAPWCGPCKMLEPVLKQLGDEWAGKMRLGHVNVDDSANLTMQFGIMGVPTTILFVNGQPVERVSGYQPKDRLIAKFGAHL